MTEFSSVLLMERLRFKPRHLVTSYGRGRVNTAAISLVVKDMEEEMTDWLSVPNWDEALMTRPCDVLCYGK